MSWAGQWVSKWEAPWTVPKAWIEERNAQAEDED
jgi:hypothetical protein